MDPVTSDPSEKPKWLKRLQENSWEAEILISGGAIFSLLQLGDYVSTFSTSLKEILLLTGHNETLIFLLLAINGVTIGFFSHLVLRGFWIGLVCLHYGSPLGINFNKLKVQGYYLEEAKSFNLLNQIIKLDGISGEMFFLSLSFLLVVAGFILISGVSVFFISAFGISELIFFALSIVFFLDLLSGGLLRRSEMVGKIYRPLYLYFNYLSLAFIYRPWFQVFFTNSNRWKVFVGGLAFLAITIFFTVSSVSRPLHYRSIVDDRKLNLSFGNTGWMDNFYENRVLGEKIAYASIQADLVTDNYLRIFIPYKVRYDSRIIGQNAGSFQEIVNIKLNAQLIPYPDWVAGDVSNQLGITCYLPIEQLPKGKHSLMIELKGSRTEFPFPLTIPFWKQ